MRNFNELALKRFLLGLVAHLKNEGAIMHPALDSYIGSRGNTYLISQRHIRWMPNFGPSTRAPIFPTNRAGSRFDLLLSQSASHRTWYQAWAEKCFLPVNILIRSVADRLYALVVKALVEEGLLEERRMGGDLVWGIRPERLRIAVLETPVEMRFFLL